MHIKSIWEKNEERNVKVQKNEEDYELDLSYNGLPIHEINVNGESFFGGNSTLALENLPAKLVSKIKVYDKRSELEKITKVRKGGENYVLDLQTKREFNGTLINSAGQTSSSVLSIGWISNCEKHIENLRYVMISQQDRWETL